MKVRKLYFLSDANRAAILSALAPPLPLTAVPPPPPPPLSSLLLLLEVVGVEEFVPVEGLGLAPASSNSLWGSVFTATAPATAWPRSGGLPVIRSIRRMRSMRKMRSIRSFVNITTEINKSRFINFLHVKDKYQRKMNTLMHLQIQALRKTSEKR